MNDCVGILLAAGASRRFGTDKRLHRLPDGTPMALASARRLLAACPRSLAIVRPGDDVLATLLTRAGMPVIVCPDAELGMGHTLAAGVAAAAEASGWLVALADMPYIAGGSYLAVIAALADGAAIARPTFEGRPGHPVGFSAAFKTELLGLRGDRGGKAIIDAHREALRLCPVDDPGVEHDIDTPAAASK